MHKPEVTIALCSEAYLNAVLRRHVSCDQSACGSGVDFHLRLFFSPPDSKFFFNELIVDSAKGQVRLIVCAGLAKQWTCVCMCVWMSRSHAFRDGGVCGRHGLPWLTVVPLSALWVACLSCKQSLRGVQKKCLHLIDLDFTGLADQAMADILMENSARSRASGFEVINPRTSSFFVCVC